MPLYDYRCSSPGCAYQFEAFTPMRNAGNPRSCPSCGGVGQRVYTAPTVVSDATQYRGDNTDGKQFDHPAMREFHLQKARQAGVTTAGKAYYPELARFPADPQAWCGSADDIRRVANKEGYDVDGDVKVRARRKDVEPEKGGINESVVKEMVGQELARNPGANRKKLVEDVVNRHAPASAKRIVKSPPKRRGKGVKR